MNDNRDPGLPDADVDARIARLGPEKRALLLQRLSPRSRDLLAREVSSSRSGEPSFELSFAQQRLWFLEQWEGGGALYNIGRGWWLQGRLEVARLHEALGRLIARHESLRTVFVGEGGQPRQQVLADVVVEVPLVDLCALPAAEARAQALERAQVLARQGFDLTRAPLLRLTLIRVTESTHLLVLVMHHIVSDGWSMGVFWRELSVLYAGDGESLPALPVQYPDYAQWQRAELQDAARERQLAYWRTRLAGLTTLELPTDRPRPAAPNYRGARHALALSAELSAALKQVSRREGVTLYMLLLAAFQVLLARYSGQDDIAVGSPIAGRTRREFEGLIGFFVNTLVLRTNLSGNPRFRDLLARVRESALDAYAHQEVPFEKLVEELKPERVVSRNPLFQVMFVLQNAPGGGLTLPGLEVTAQALDTATAKFDLSLTCIEGPAGLRGTLQYATDLFDGATIARLAGHFTTLLEGIVADPETPIGELPLLAPAERHQLLVQWNDTAADYPRDRCIHQLFEEQAARTPDAVAVVFEDRQLTYAELNARANQLAHCLRSHGVGPDVLVGICVERSLELVVGLLGILKAGGAYVPLDPELPRARLAFMLEDTQAPVLMTQERLLGALPPQAGRTLCLDRDWPTVAAQPATNPSCHTNATHLAYVIYTSGSTGKPKGVMIEHRALVNHMEWMRRKFDLESSDSVLQKTPISFDAAVWEFFAPLLVGGRLVMAPPGAHRSPAEIIAALQKHGLTTVQLVPSLFRLLVRDAGLADCVQLSRVFCGGEVLPGDAAQRFFEHSRAHLYNLYGPTETCIESLSWECKRDDRHTTVPIGRPIANAEVYVLDGHRQPVPVGVAGELYIGGDGLARGYWNRPELTAERFVPDPFSGHPGARLYRTGDRARHLPDGNIEFLGRLDTQVKLRGFRIELGEIEAVLAQQPQVRDAVVQLREDTPGDSRLVAYVVAQGGALVAVGLRAALKQQLPDYMIPAAFVPLPALPLTPSGKVDRKALPAPQGGTEATLSSPPRNPVEEAVAGVWCELLHLHQVGVHDNFFDLGGHSLLAIQMLSWLRDVLGVEISVRAMFEAPTIADLAGHISAALLGDEQDRTLPIKPQPRPIQLPLSFAQQRLWLLDKLSPMGSTYNVNHVLRLSGPLDDLALRGALNELVRRHDILRSRFGVQDGQPVMVIAPELNIALAVEDLSEFAPQEPIGEARRRAQAEVAEPFDLALGPLIRARLMRLTATEHWLLLTLHHIVTDGWSSGVLARELTTLYDACRRREASPLPALPMQYADYALWQRQWLQGPVLERQLEYWRVALAELPTLDLPTVRSRPAVASHRGGRVRFEVPESLTRSLNALGRRENATLFMTLLAAYQVLLFRYSGQEDIAVGVPISGRTQIEFEGLIGFFVNTLVLRGDLSGGPSFTKYLAQVRARALDAFTHQDLPFEKLVEELAPKRDLSRNPLFQASLVLQNAPSRRWRLSGLDVQQVEGVRSATAKFDLAMSLTESGGMLAGSLEYATELFEPAAIERMAGHFLRLLEGIVANPESRVDALALLTAPDRHRLLVEWNDTTASQPEARCIHQLFEEQAARTPDAVAVVFEDRQLTYAELDARANQLAHYLRGKGVEPDVLVGLCLERSLELVVGLLGILKAGAAYLPLDPDLPKERLAFMLEDAAASTLVTQRALLVRLPEGPQAVCLDRDCAAIAAHPDTAPDADVQASHLAYVMYTSGSTGVPKGVMVTHHNVVRLFSATRPWFHFDANDVWTCFHSCAFDFSVWEMWGALIHGGRLVMVPFIVSRDPDAFHAMLRRERVTVLNQTPSAFRQLDAADARAGGTSELRLRLVIFGGEALEMHWLRSWLERHGDAAPQLVNMYGITETTVHVTYRPIRRADLDRAHGSMIGERIPDLRVYVLDRRLEPVPVGVPGEIVVGGAGVARGYLNRPELTSERFVADPFSGNPAARLYRSGDLARFTASGELEYLGRIDQQVKLRGFRIEPGEIEATLARHPEVREAVVLLREDVPGNPLLAAYVVAREVGLAVAQLRAWLKRQLPPYMVPTAFVLLPALPLTPNGKVNRKALPKPDNETSGSAPEIPPTPIESIIAEIWASVLNRQQVDIDDDFFDLGGHSLLAVQLMSRINQALEVELNLRQLFETPTVRGLALTALDVMVAGANADAALQQGATVP